MMAAAQPFLSGAISKTVNMPENRPSRTSRTRTSKAGSWGSRPWPIYRDGSKRASRWRRRKKGTEEQPRSRRCAVAPQRERLARHRGSRSPTSSPSAATKATSPSGLFDDGKPGELFITMAKEGSTIGGLMDSIGTADVDVPAVRRAAARSGQQVLAHAVRADGVTENPDIRMPRASSITSSAGWESRSSPAIREAKLSRTGKGDSPARPEQRAPSRTTVPSMPMRPDPPLARTLGLSFCAGLYLPGTAGGHGKGMGSP